MSVSPYPQIYTPKGVSRPGCCFHNGPLRVLEGHGPDWDPDAKTGGGGMIWGGTYRPGPCWRKAGDFWVHLIGQRPQDVIRTTIHPRVKRRIWVKGALPAQKWSVPVLLEKVGDRAFRPIVDGIWDGSRWSAGDLEPLIEQLIAFAHELELADDRTEIDATLRMLAVSILAIDHWVDEPLMVVSGWLSESLMQAAVLGCAGVPDIGEDMI
jgi:hypothetical protein